MGDIWRPGKFLQHLKYPYCCAPFKQLAQPLDQNTFQTLPRETPCSAAFIHHLCKASVSIIQAAAASMTRETSAHPALHQSVVFHQAANGQRYERFHLPISKCCDPSLQLGFHPRTAGSRTGWFVLETHLDDCCFMPPKPLSNPYPKKPSPSPADRQETTQTLPTIYNPVRN